MKMSERGAHDAKMTVYMTSRELLALDHMILEMRRVYGIKVDRSHFVREALAAASGRKIAERLKDAASA
jgi:hypothetical protein